jgi:DNA invertase Pin-like site-specific DNA recombinase
MKKAIVYYRVSTKGQGESGLGLDAQQQYVNHYYGNNPEFQIMDSVTEVASAKSLNPRKRPLLNDAIKRCKENGYYLIVAKLDRLSRITEDALFISSELGERLLSCDIPNMDKFTLTIFIAIADRERDLISMRTKNAMKSLKERRVKLLNTGETITTKKGKTSLVTDVNWRTSDTQKWSNEAREKGQKSIKEDAETNENTIRARDYAKILRDKGMTLEAIAEHLNERKFLTPRKKAFQKASILRLLAE